MAVRFYLDLFYPHFPLQKSRPSSLARPSTRDFTSMSAGDGSWGLTEQWFIFSLSVKAPPSKCSLWQRLCNLGSFLSFMAGGHAGSGKKETKTSDGQIPVIIIILALTDSSLATLHFQKNPQPMLLSNIFKCELVVTFNYLCPGGSKSAQSPVLCPAMKTKLYFFQSPTVTGWVIGIRKLRVQCGLCRV